jgi:hypothetical protein
MRGLALTPGPSPAPPDPPQAGFWERGDSGERLGHLMAVDGHCEQLVCPPLNSPAEGSGEPSGFPRGEREGQRPADLRATKPLEEVILRTQRERFSPQPVACKWPRGAAHPAPAGGASPATPHGARSPRGPPHVGPGAVLSRRGACRPAQRTRGSSYEAVRLKRRGCQTTNHALPTAHAGVPRCIYRSGGMRRSRTHRRPHRFPRLRGTKGGCGGVWGTGTVPQRGA